MLFKGRGASSDFAVRKRAAVAINCNTDQNEKIISLAIEMQLEGTNYK